MAVISRDIDKKYEEAKKHVHKLVTVYKSNNMNDKRILSEAYLNFGMTILSSLATEPETEDLMVAKDYFEQASEVDDSWSEPWMWLGLIWEHLNNPEKSDENYMKGIDLRK